MCVCACVCVHDVWFLRMSPRVSGWFTERDLLSAKGSFAEIDPQIYTLFCACIGVIYSKWLVHEKRPAG